MDSLFNIAINQWLILHSENHEKTIIPSGSRRYFFGFYPARNGRECDTIVVIRIFRLNQGGITMLHVQLMKPFYSKLEGQKMKLVFAYQYFSIKKDDELFHFIPVEGKEIIVNMTTYQVENLSEVFVFQKGNRFIRLPLYQLLLVSDIHTHLQTILQHGEPEDREPGSDVKAEADEFISLLEEVNHSRMIDYALQTRDENLFNRLLH